MNVKMPSDLPEPIAGYLHARAAGDVEGALAWCTDDPTLLDVDVLHAGREAIRAVLARPIVERHLTFATTDSVQVGPDEWDVGQRIEGDIEGGRFDMTYHFTLQGDRISRLDIELRTV